MKEQADWIDATLNLPCNEQDVLVWQGYFLQSHEVAYWNGTNWICSHSNDLKQVTHWMPLPEPPTP